MSMSSIGSLPEKGRGANSEIERVTANVSVDFGIGTLWCQGEMTSIIGAPSNCDVLGPPGWPMT